jgi:hypothetical protein
MFLGCLEVDLGHPSKCIGLGTLWLYGKCSFNKWADEALCEFFIEWIIFMDRF